MSTAVQPVQTPKAKPRASQGRRKREPLLRTTVSLTRASAAIVEEFKAATGLSTSRTIDELIQRSVPQEPRVKMVNGLAVFDLPIEPGSITNEMLRRLEDESWGRPTCLT